MTPEGFEEFSGFRSAAYISDGKLLVCAEAATLFSLLKVVYPKV